MNLVKTMYAGLDVDGKAKLFYLDKQGVPHVVTNEEWVAVLAAAGAQVGEMLVVELVRESEYPLISMGAE